MHMRWAALLRSQTGPLGIFFPKIKCPRVVVATLCWREADNLGLPYILQAYELTVNAPINPSLDTTGESTDSLCSPDHVQEKKFRKKQDEALNLSRAELLLPAVLTDGEERFLTRSLGRHEAMVDKRLIG